MKKIITKLVLLVFILFIGCFVGCTEKKELYIEDENIRIMKVDVKLAQDRYEIYYKGKFLCIVYFSSNNTERLWKAMYGKNNE